MYSSREKQRWLWKRRSSAERLKGLPPEQGPAFVPEQEEKGAKEGQAEEEAAETWKTLSGRKRGLERVEGRQPTSVDTLSREETILTRIEEMFHGERPGRM